MKNWLMSPPEQYKLQLMLAWSFNCILDRAVELLALELGKLQSKLKSMTSQKSSEILKSVAEEIHLQLQNVHSQIQTDM